MGFITLSDNMKEILLVGLKNEGVVTVDDARNCYSSTKKAEKGLKRLVRKGNLKRRKDANGIFDIKRVPDDVKEEYQEWEKRQGD